MTKTIEELRAEGESHAKEIATIARELKEANAKRVVATWDMLVVRATSDLGVDLAKCSTPALTLGKPPLGFTGQSETIRLNLCPFGAGQFSVAYIWSNSKTMVKPVLKDFQIAFTVEQGYQSGPCSAGSKAKQIYHQKDEVVTHLGYAVYLCALQTEGYLQAKEEVEKHNAAMYGKPAA